MHFTDLISFKKWEGPVSTPMVVWECRTPCRPAYGGRGRGWFWGSDTQLQAPSWTCSSVGSLCDKVVSCVCSTRKGIVTKANSDTWYRSVHARARANLHEGHCWQLLEVVVVQKLHSVPLATHVHGFVLMWEPFLSENSEHPHGKYVQ